MKRVLVVGPIPPPYNGQSVATRITVEELRHHGLALDPINLAAQDRTGHSGLFTIERSVQLIRLFWAFLKALLLKRPNVIYLTVSQSKAGFLRDAAFVLLGRLFGCRVIAHAHGGAYDRLFLKQSPYFKWGVKLIYGLIERVVILDGSLAKMFHGIKPISDLVPISNPIEAMFSPTPDSIRQRMLTIDTWTPPLRLLFLSNLIPSKGYADVINAVDILVKSGTNVSCVLAGSFPTPAARLETLEIIGRKGLKQHVSYIGVVTGEAKKQLFEQSDVFLLPTYYENEGLPISVLEAMASGLSLVVTSHRVLAEIVRDGVNGIVVPPRDPVKIAAAISRLFSCEVRKEITLTNMQYAQRTCTAEEYGNKILAALFPRQPL